MRLAFLLPLALAAAPAIAADAKHPAVVELFQSQGCSSCPPANDTLIDYSRRPDVLALTYAVTYWDRLGWKDTFGSPDYTERQYAYARTLGASGVYTPQVVVNGRADGVGTSVGEVEQLMAKTDRGGAGPAVSLAKSEATVGAGNAPAGGAEVWLVGYDPRVLDVPVARGENAGRTLPHKNVVRSLTRLGAWSGAAATFALPALPSGLSRAVLVQGKGVGPILAAAKD